MIKSQDRQAFAVNSRDLEIVEIVPYVNVYSSSCLSLRERNHIGDPGIDERIILRWIFRK
jgi:hypothetical protein